MIACMRFRRRQRAHHFTDEDRKVQLADLELLCGDLAQLYAENGDSITAAAFADRSERAASLQQTGWTRADLNDLGGQFPDGGWWLNPKAADFNAPRTPWQDEVARIYPLAKNTADNLRATATLYKRS